jgi:sugar/nucleoside kinase (ribokinase family)
MPFDVIGIGALNLDYIVTKEELAGTDYVSSAFGFFDPGTEKVISKSSEFDKLIAELTEEKLGVFYGGSAFNTIRALAQLQAKLALGYVGVAGHPPPGHDHDFIAECRRLNIDTTFVQQTTERAGQCVSFVSGDTRQLLTLPGANTQFSAVLGAQKDAIVHYLSQARIIHVTSLLDDHSPKLLADVLEAVKTHMPAITVSIDPGYVWIDQRPPDILRILKLADVLFLNEREFNALGNPAVDDERAIKHIHQEIGIAPALVVLKRYDSISCLLYDPLGGDVIRNEVRTQTIPTAEIRDDTGAGDIFAAGFLASRLLRSLYLRDVSYGVDLGHTLVRAKLRKLGDRAYKEFSEILISFLKTTSRGRGEMSGPVREGLLLASAEGLIEWKKKSEQDAQRQAKRVVFAFRILFSLLLISIGIFVLRPVLQYWDQIEPIAWWLSLVGTLILIVLNLRFEPFHWVSRLNNKLGRYISERRLRVLRELETILSRR